MKYICSLIVVENIKESREFYENVLGLQVIEDYGENVVFEGSFAIHLKEHYQKLIKGRDITFRSNSFELYFEDNDISSLYVKLKSVNVDFVHEPQEQPWRQLVVRFYDPDGHVIEVGESFEHLTVRLYKEGMSIEDISKVTYLDEVKVRTLIPEI